MTVPDRRLNVLLVDDDAGSLSRFHELLSQAGTEVELECVTTSLAELAAFRKDSYDIGIIDSPQGNAVNLLAEARRVGCAYPLIVVTSDRAEEVLAAIHNGAADCIVRNDLSAAGLERIICLVIEQAELQRSHNENELRYLSLVENASEIIYTHDLEGNYTSVSQSVMSLTGYTKEEALKLNASQVVAPEYLEFVNTMLSRKLVEQKQTSYEIEIVTKERKRIPIDVSTHLIYRNGKPVAVQGLARDINRHREVEALPENEGDFTSLNRAGEPVTDYSRHAGPQQETILLVEDEEAVLDLSRRVLETNGYTVLTAANGLEACAVSKSFAGNIALLVTDVVMPHMGGRQLADVVSAMRPKICVLYMSGYSEDAIVRNGVLEDEISFLQKPFSPDTLAQKVKEILDKAASSLAA